jgi:hypothetical protein
MVPQPNLNIAQKKIKIFAQATEEFKRHEIRLYQEWTWKLGPEPHFHVNSHIDGKIL